MATARGHYGTVAIIRDFPFALYLFLGLHDRAHSMHKLKANRLASTRLGSARERQMSHGRLFSRPRARVWSMCGVETTERAGRCRRRRRLQPEFNETSRGPSNRFS